MEWSEIIREIAFPIGNVFLFITLLYQYRTGRRPTIVQRHNISIILLFTFITITPVIVLVKDEVIDILIDAIMGLSAILGLGYFLYYLPSMLKNIWST